MYRTIGHQTDGSEGRNIVEAVDGGYFLTYYTYISGTFIGAIVKLDCSGQVIWEKFFEEAFTALPVEIIPQSDNGCLLLLSVRIIDGTYRNAVLRVDASGNTLWTLRLPMQSAGPTGSMAQHTDGSVYVCGVDSVPTTAHNGTAIAKINSAGQLQWIKHYGDNVDHTPRAITVTPDHRIVVTGVVPIPTFIFTNLFVFAINQNGDFLKRKIFTTTYDDEPLSICADNSGNVAITGYSYFISSEWDMFFLKLDNQLNVLQSKVYDGGSAQGEQSRYISATSDNTFALFGDEGGFNERNPMMLKLDSNGFPIWAKRYTISPQFTNYLFYGSQCRDGGFLMTGDARPVNQFRIAPFIKTDADGNMGCFTSPLVLTVRDEVFTQLDVPLTAYPVNISQDNSSVPYTSLPIPTSNTSVCQSLSPCGTFNWVLDTLCPVPCFLFNENSLLADEWNWTFENGTPASSNSQQPLPVCYTSPGPHTVTLTLSNAAGSVTYTQQIFPEINCPFSIPNIFTPDGDGINDVFHAIGLNEPFRLQIFSRWGLELFSSSLPGKWWDGRSDSGEPVAGGVYFYVITAPVSNRVFKGTVEVVR